ncbi:SET domain-containing protein, partial [Polychaeton citri CBS 116435]
MTRQPSSESSSLSNINVSGQWTNSGHSSPEPSTQDAVLTPPTSMVDSNAVPSTISNDGQNGGRRKSARAKKGVDSYNLEALCDEQLLNELSPAKPQLGRSGSNRNVSGLTGRTLVDSEDGNGKIDANADMEFNMDVEMSDTPQPPRRISPGKLGRKHSVKDRMKKAAGKLSSVLGKRSREVMEKGKERLKWKDEKADKVIRGTNSRMVKQLDTGSKGLLDEIDLDAEASLKQRPSKKIKTSTTGRASAVKAEQLPAPSNPMQKTSSGKRVKKWQTAGLYVGQFDNGDPAQPGSRGKKLQKKRPTSVPSEEGIEVATPNKYLNMSLPLFSYLDIERPFTIPYDVFAPSLKKGDERPKDWHQLNKNRLVGGAKDMWVKEVNLARSVCLCRNGWNGKDEGCGDECLNRSMEYECNEDNCDLPAWACSNRAFSGLAVRNKKGGPYDIGVEVVKTNNRGFGVKACRSFLPGQIVMEYTGEIITEEECQRRMHEVYKDKSNFYLMEMERGTHIDGTKGSMARFINHSCAPNCIVRLVKVNGVPRMGVFAGEGGIMTGEELTYDYNFDNFGDNMQQCFCGAQTCRGHLGKKLSAIEQKKRDREEVEKSRLAALKAQKAAEKEARANAARSEADKASWRGWADLNDPETRKRLKAEQEAKRAKEATSDRAMRLASRRDSLPLPS